MQCNACVIVARCKSLSLGRRKSGGGRLNPISSRGKIYFLKTIFPFVIFYFSKVEKFSPQTGLVKHVAVLSICVNREILLLVQMEADSVSHFPESLGIRLIRLRSVRIPIEDWTDVTLASELDCIRDNVIYKRPLKSGETLRNESPVVFLGSICDPDFLAFFH